MTQHAPQPVACLLGPTASGKTAAALAFAARAAVEIVSVDSALVYREMDIGTAKPSSEERAVAPHHLIDIVDPATPTPPPISARTRCASSARSLSAGAYHCWSAARCCTTRR